MLCEVTGVQCPFFCHSLSHSCVIVIRWVFRIIILQVGGLHEAW